MGEQRPGGWVPGIGWVALLHSLPDGAVYEVVSNDEVFTNHFTTMQGQQYAHDRPVIVNEWPDGTVPALASPQRPQADGRPETDAGQLREAAAWLDTYDQMARVFFDLIERSAGSMPDDLRERAKALIPAASSDEVQTDLRRIADDLAAAALPVRDRADDEAEDAAILLRRCLGRLAAANRAAGPDTATDLLLLDICEHLDEAPHPETVARLRACEELPDGATPTIEAAVARLAAADGDHCARELCPVWDGTDSCGGCHLDGPAAADPETGPHGNLLPLPDDVERVLDDLTRPDPETGGE